MQKAIRMNKAYSIKVTHHTLYSQEKHNTTPMNYKATTNP